MDGEEQTSAAPTSGRIVMSNSPKKIRSIFTTTGPVAGVQSYAPSSNPLPVLHNGAALRPVHFSPLPCFMGPRFPGHHPHPQYYNRLPYPVVHGMVPVFPSTSTTAQPQQRTHPPTNESSINYDQVHQLPQSPHYSGARFPNPQYLHRNLYPVPHGMMPPFSFPPTTAQPLHTGLNGPETQFNYNQLQNGSFPVVSDQDISLRKTDNGGIILPGAPENTSVIQQFESDAYATLERDAEKMPNENRTQGLQDIGFHVEVETPTLKNDLQTSLITEPGESLMQHCSRTNSVEEERPSSSYEYSPPSTPPPLPRSGQKCSFKLDLDASVHEEVVRAAKALFSKRTRTLYHWLYPDKSKTKLKATVTSAWDTLPENEKHFYISQVLGRFGVQSGTLMINPQLDGIKGYTKEIVTTNGKTPTSRKSPLEHSESAKIEEDKKAVEDMLAIYHDPDCWNSYASPERTTNERTRKRKYGSKQDRGLDDMFSQSSENDSQNIAKRARKNIDSEADFEGDTELKSELEKFKLFADNEALLGEDTEEIWQRSPQTSDLFAEFGI